MIIALHKVNAVKIKSILDAYYEATGICAWYVDPLSWAKEIFASSRGNMSERSKKMKFFGDDVFFPTDKQEDLVKSILEVVEKKAGKDALSQYLRRNSLVYSSLGAEKTTFINTNNDPKLAPVGYDFDLMITNETEKVEDSLSVIRVGDSDSYEIILQKMKKMVSREPIEEKDAKQIAEEAMKSPSNVVYVGKKLFELNFNENLEPEITMVLPEEETLQQNEQASQPQEVPSGAERINGASRMRAAMSFDGWRRGTTTSAIEDFLANMAA